MTMPHLMNCNHSEEWCLACVKEMHDDLHGQIFQLRCQLACANAKLTIMKTALKQARALALKHGYTLRRFAEVCEVSPSRMSEWTGEVPTDPPDLVRESS